MSLQLAKMVWCYDMELIDPSLDWGERCRVHFVLKKPELYVRFLRGELEQVTVS